MLPRCALQLGLGLGLGVGSGLGLDEGRAYADAVRVRVRVRVGVRVRVSVRARVPVEGRAYADAVRARVRVRVGVRARVPVEGRAYADAVRAYGCTCGSCTFHVQQCSRPSLPLARLYPLPWLHCCGSTYVRCVTPQVRVAGCLVKHVEARGSHVLALALDKGARREMLAAWSEMLAK